MTGSDLIMLAPWIAFGAGVALIVFRLRLFQRRRRPAPPQGPGSRAPQREFHGGERR